MPSGVRIKDLLVGTGDVAEGGKVAVANVRMFLRRGDEITPQSPTAPRMVINLGRRECIAGLRYGIEGMRVGGQRRLRISPHLAYGPEGVPGIVPPNAVILCDVELLEVRELGVAKPDDFAVGKHLDTVAQLPG